MAPSLTQLLAQGSLDPAAYGGLQNVELGNSLLQSGLDATPTSGWGALGRLASTLAGTHLASQGQTSLRDAITAGRKSASADLMAALGGQPKMPAASTSAAAKPAAPAAPASSSGTAPRGIRNNNPLNIEDGPFAKGLPGYVGSDGRFAKFEAPDQGVAAANKLLDIYGTKHGLNTVAGIVGRWAPAGDGNDVSAYAANVAKQMGIDPNAPLTPEQRPALIAAMGQHENGRPIQVASLAPTAGVVAPAVQAIDGAASGKPAPAVGASPAAAAPAVAPAEDAAVPAAGAAAAKPEIDVHRLMAVMQNPYADDMTKQIAGKLILQQLSPDLTDTIKEYQFAKQENPALTFEKFLQVKKQAGNEFGLNPIYGTRVNPKTGKEETVLLQTGKTGEAVQTKIPEGVTVSSGVEKMDGGTHWILIDKRTGAVVGTQPKDVQGAAAAEKRGTEQGTAQAALPGAISDAEQTKNKIDELLKHPGLSSIVGPIDQFRSSVLLGDQGRDALARFNQLKGTAFLTAYQLLRGGGAITEVEGKKAEDAMARLDRSQSEEEFKTALKDFRSAIDTGLEKLKQKGAMGNAAGGSVLAPGAAPAGAPDRAAIEAEMKKRGLIK